MCSVVYGFHHGTWLQVVARSLLFRCSQRFASRTCWTWAPVLAMSRTQGASRTLRPRQAAVGSLRPRKTCQSDFLFCNNLIHLIRLILSYHPQKISSHLVRILSYRNCSPLGSHPFFRSLQDRPPTSLERNRSAAIPRIAETALTANTLVHSFPFEMLTLSLGGCRMLDDVTTFSCQIVSCLVGSCSILFHLILSCPIQLCPSLSYLIRYCSIIPYLILPYPTLSQFVLLYLVVLIFLSYLCVFLCPFYLSTCLSACILLVNKSILIQLLLLRHLTTWSIELPWRISCVCHHQVLRTLSWKSQRSDSGNLRNLRLGRLGISPNDQIFGAQGWDPDPGNGSLEEHPTYPKQIATSRLLARLHQWNHQPKTKANLNLRILQD